MLENKTNSHVEECFLKVSRAAARKKLYALRAEQDGNAQLARLFRAIAVSEDAQAIRLLIQLRGQTGSNEQNYQTAFEEEIPSLIEQYEQGAETAAEAGERAMGFAFRQSAKVERIHLSLKMKLEKDAARDKSYHVCTFCGFIMEDHAPDTCPICTAPASRFKQV